MNKYEQDRERDLPCEGMLRDIFGSAWRTLPEPEIYGPWGVAIIAAILYGDVRPNPHDISDYLGGDRKYVFRAFKNMSLNGVFQGDRLYQDRKVLDGDDMSPWCYYAGYASGFTGPVIIRD